MTSLRVAHVISTPWGAGGAERTVAALVNGLTDITQLVLNPFARDAADRAFADQLPEEAYRFRVTRSARQLAGARRWLMRQLDDFAPDIVHAHLFHAEVLTASLPRRCTPVRLLTHQHGPVLARQGRRAAAALEGLSLRRFDHVAAVSIWVRQWLIDEQGLAPGRVALVGNGWEGTPLPHQESGPVVVCVANLRWEKRHEDLITAFAVVSRRIPEARLVLVGDGPRRAELEALVGTLGLTEAVEFRGVLADIWPELARAAVFAMTSVYETLGLVVVEAMAAGLPVVATAVGGLTELVQPERNGLLVQPGDVDALAAALERLLTDDEARRRMGAGARESAAARGVGTMLAEYRALYDRAAPRA